MWFGLFSYALPPAKRTSVSFIGAILEEYLVSLIYILFKVGKGPFLSDMKPCLYAREHFLGTSLFFCGPKSIFRVLGSPSLVTGVFLWCHENFLFYREHFLCDKQQFLVAWGKYDTNQTTFSLIN